MAGANTVEHTLEFDKVTKIYRNFWLRQSTVALKDFSMKMEKGEIVGLLGPNGSGKSTALKLSVGLLKVTEGSVRLAGNDPRRAKSRDVLGYLPEENANYPNLTGRSALKLHGLLAGLPRREASIKCNELLELVGLDDASDRKTSTYSKGMGRRLGLAQCLIGEPEILVLDEPTSGLDPLATEMVRTILIGLREKGVSVLLSSHLLAEIQDICDRLVVLSEGKTLQQGSAIELLEIKGQRDIRIHADAELSDETRALLASKGNNVLCDQHARKSLAEFYRQSVSPQQSDSSQEQANDEE